MCFVEDEEEVLGIFWRRTVLWQELRSEKVGACLLQLLVLCAGKSV